MMFERLERLRMVVVTGKGGVGKSVLTAALGRLLAARGRRTLLAEMDPRESLHRLLDVEPSGGDVVEVGPRLALQHTSPRDALDDLVREKLKLGILARKVLDSPVHQHFAEGAPGLKQTAVFARVLRQLEGHGLGGTRRPDVVLLDAPATGHGVSLMKAPRLVSEVIESGPVGHLAAEVAAFVGDPDACGIVVVTTAEEMPVQESLELLDVLDDELGRGPELVVVNGLYPALQPTFDPGDDPVAELWRHRREVNDRELERLASVWDGPLVQLPLLPIDPGPALIGALGRRLQERLS
jgi:anion-transporting  ArsA/GET3 family ATPase